MSADVLLLLPQERREPRCPYETTAQTFELIEFALIPHYRRMRRFLQDCDPGDENDCRAE